MQDDNTADTVVILGTGGTIAGATRGADDWHDYRAGQIGIEQLIDAVPALAGLPIRAEQIAQVDSKDMDFALWQRLALRCTHWLADPAVRGLVITHGTDTLEETAFFLSQVLDDAKPVVLTCAMRPATAPQPDGPQNLCDAVTVARDPAACGVLAVCAGQVHAARTVQKVHPERLDAFSSGAAGPLATIDSGAVTWHEKPPLARTHQTKYAIEKIAKADAWPWVEIVLNHAGASGEIVRALTDAGVRGLVAAGTGNGTLHQALEAALRQAQSAGVRVVRATRCSEGAVTPRADDPFEPSNGLSAVKARVALLLDLLAGRDDGSTSHQGLPPPGGAISAPAPPAPAR